jgi:glycosyltransferase involved in cell wall biosynthesis
MSRRDASTQDSDQQLKIDRPLRVLLVVHELFPGASSVPLDAFELIKSEITLQTLALRGGFLEDRYRRLGRVDIVPAWEKPLHRRLRRKWFLWRLCRTLAKFRPDLLYLNSIVSLRPAKALPLPKVPVLVHVHELESYVEPALAESETLLREWPDRYVVVSDAVHTLLVKDLRIPEAKVARVHAFIRDDVMSLSDKQNGLSRRGGQRPFVVGGAGRPTWRKGITLWLQVAVALKSLLPTMSVEFRWVGMIDNAESRAVKLEARKLGIEDIVKFIAHTEQPLDQYREFDVFAMTSWEDPCPLVVLENMALGKPVVCFAGGGGAAEEIGDGGVIVPEFSPEMMAAAVAELAEDTARREALGREARSRVRRIFVASVQAPRLLEELRRTAAEHHMDPRT